MKMSFVILFILISSTVVAQTQDNYLKSEDQKFFKNDVNEGNNQFERININVREINKLHGEVARMKEEISKLKEEIELLKKK